MFIDMNWFLRWAMWSMGILFKYSGRKMALYLCPILQILVISSAPLHIGVIVDMKARLFSF